MWKVGGIKIESAAGRQKKNASGDGISWKMEFFCKSLRTRKFSMGKFFGASTHGIVTHSGFRKCIWKVGTTNFDPVLPARSWEMPVKCELPAKIGWCYEKPSGHNFDFRTKSSWEKIFNIYRNFLSGGFRSKVKIVTAQLFATPHYFCWQLAFYRHLPTSGRQNRVQNLLYPPFIYIFWILSA